MKAWTAGERRARLVERHLLHSALRSQSVEQAARSVVALHATDPATVVLSAAARLAEPAVAGIERALYRDRSLVRVMAMRRTLWAVPRELLPVVKAAASDAVAARERATLVRRLAAGADPGESERLIESGLDEVTAYVHASDGATAAEVARDLPHLARRVSLPASGAGAATASLASRLLLLASMEMRVVRGRPAGGWTSGRFLWHSAARWLGEPVRSAEPDEARARLAAAWLSRFGPAPAGDLQWWTGWSGAQTREALAMAGAPASELEDGTPVFTAAGDTAEPRTRDPEAVLLPALDPTTMGWKARDWYLGPHAAATFDRNGNAGPTAWWGGRVVGAWSQQRDGRIAVTMLPGSPPGAAPAVAEAAEALQSWLGPVRVLPRFPTGVAEPDDRPA